MYRLYSGRRSHMIHCCHHLSGLWRASRHCCPHMLEMLDHRMYAYCIYKYLSNICTLFEVLWLKPHKPTIVVRRHRHIPSCLFLSQGSYQQQSDTSCYKNHLLPPKMEIILQPIRYLLINHQMHSKCNVFYVVVYHTRA